MIFIPGTISDTVRITEMTQTWEKKKSQIGKTKEKEKSPEVTMLEMYRKDLAEMRKNNKMSAIASKVNSGDELSAEDLDYLRQNSPELYQEYLEIQREKEAYKKQLENCKTKEEVERLQFTKLSECLSSVKNISSNANIPDSTKMALLGKILGKILAMREVQLEFERSLTYQSLEEEKVEETETSETTEDVVEKPDTGSEEVAIEHKEDEQKSVEVQQPKEVKLTFESVVKIVETEKKEISGEKISFGEIKKAKRSEE